jgi:hypothetical protein
MHRTSVIIVVGVVTAWVAALGAPRAASADITVDVSATWPDFAATAAAVDVLATNDTGNPDHRVCVLTMTDAYSGHCMVTFPDADAGSGAGSFSAQTISVVTCDASVFGPPDNLSASAPSCGTIDGGDAATHPPGAWWQFSPSGGVLASPGDHVDLVVDFVDGGTATIMGKIALPPGVQIAHGTVQAQSGGEGSVQAFGTIAGPDADGTYDYSVPVAAGPFASVTSLTFAVELPSGFVTFFFASELPISSAGQVVQHDLPATSFTHVSGAVTWNTLQALSGSIIINGTAFSSGPIAVSGNHLSGTYDALVMADDDPYFAVDLSTCLDPQFCEPGIAVSFFPGSPLDTIGQGGTTITEDIQVSTAFTTLSGTVSVIGATLQGGSGQVYASDGPSSVVTTFEYGSDGAYSATIGLGGASAVFVATATECASLVSTFVDLGNVGADPVQRDVPIAVDASPLGSAAVHVGLDALFFDVPYATYQVDGVWLGDPTVAYCNGGATSVSQSFSGRQEGTGLPGLRSGPWSFRYNASGTQTSGGTSFTRSFDAPPIEVTVPSGAAADVDFVSSPPTFSGSLATTSWQLGENDGAFLLVNDTSAGTDGSASQSNVEAVGAPAGDALPVTLIVADEPLGDATLEAGATYLMGPASSSTWVAQSGTPLPTLAQGEIQSMPGLDALQITGIGTWTITDLAPPGAEDVGATFFAQAGNFTLGGAAFPPPLVMKLPAGSYGSGPQVSVTYLDPSSNFVFNTFPIGGEIAPGDALTDTVHSPLLLNRTPAPGTYCGGGPSGSTRIKVGFTVASDVRQVQSVTVGGRRAQADAGGNVSSKVTLPLGTWPSNVSATQTSGDRTSWDRSYTVPFEITSLPPLGALVPDGATPVPVPAVAIQPAALVTLSLAVTSCGHRVGSRDAYARVPRIVAVSLGGQDVPLATLTIGVLDADGAIDFRRSGNGTWKLRLATKLLGPGTYLMKLQAPDASLWDANLVVGP